MVSVHGLPRWPIGVLASLLLLLGGRASWANIDNRPIVVLRIDDCSVDWNVPYNGLDGMTPLAYGTLKHIPITWAAVTGMASAGTSLTWAQLRAYLDANGGEAASHSVHHAAMSSQQDYINEVIDSKAAIEANLPGYRCDTFLQPGPWTDEAYMDLYSELDGPIGQAIQANYAQSMAYLGGGWRIGEVYYRYGTTSNYSIDTQNTPSIAAVNYLLDVIAATPGLVYVITGHAVQETGQTASYHIAADILKATMDKLADLRDQSKIKLMSLNDAFHTALSPDLNRVSDPGFSLANLSILRTPWDITGSGQMVNTGGLEDSRYCSLPDNGSTLRGTLLCLPPGRYQMDWHQKVINNKQNSGLVLAFVDYGANWSPAWLSANWAFFYNTSPSTWEKKTALVLVPDRMNMSWFTFQPASGGGYGIDSVSLVSSPTDPAVSPSASVISASPGQCMLSWHTPADPAVLSVIARYGDKTHPLTPTSGTSFCSVTAQPETTQQVTVPINWTATSASYLYFSVFGSKSGGACTPPDIVWIKIDKTAPTTPVVTASINTDGSISAQWSSSEPDSQIAQYQYALGRSAGASDVKLWAFTTSAGSTISEVGTEEDVYVSVMAQNQFGFWSAYGSTRVSMPSGIASAIQHADGATVCVSGIVSAVFGDCYYVQDANRRGIKVVGNTSSIHECDSVVVQGTLATANGERYIQQ